MFARKRALSWLIPLLSLPVLTKSTRELPDITDPTFIEGCVAEHNQARSRVSPPASNMRYMTWDKGLAITARAWASFCLFKHNVHLKQKGKVHPVFTSVGENIWAGAPFSSFSVKSAINSWINEVRDFDYETLKCNKVCGHYTQVVWGDTYKVGCAVQACPDGVAETTFSSLAGAIFVCNYATAGNYNGRRPYEQGHSCSRCDKETCENHLCHNATRDATRWYNWTPDWDPVHPRLGSLFICGSFCKALLIIRPLSVLLIFISVRVLQFLYPNLFVYTA